MWVEEKPDRLPRIMLVEGKAGLAASNYVGRGEAGLATLKCEGIARLAALNYVGRGESRIGCPTQFKCEVVKDMPQVWLILNSKIGIS